MKLKSFFSLMIIFGLQWATAQQADTLFTVKGEPVFAKEFERVYKKNIELVTDESQKDIDTYLQLFINYKLKVRAAYGLSLDTSDSYKREFEGYKRQLTNKYISDNEVTERLVKEAYERLKYEVNATHILVRLPEDANEAETAAALKKIKALRVKVLEKGFDVLKKEDHSKAKGVYVEELGYFTAFKMVYNFETAAYNTTVGEVSEPFRTSFGFHVLKVNAKRENRGEVTVSHIMIGKNKNKEVIDDVYKLLKQGGDFRDLAKQYSDDKASASNGGLLTPFSSGQLSSEKFEEAAFSLKEIGDYTKPIKTKFGYHIIKLYAKKGLGKYENEERRIINLVKRDSRSKILEEKLLSNLKEKYNVTYNQPKLKTVFKPAITDYYFKGLWSVPKTLATDSTDLVTIGTKTLADYDFATFLNKEQRRIHETKDVDELLTSMYKLYIDRNLRKYQEENLINENEEFASILKEYQEGLLLFDLMGKRVWNKSAKDTVAQKEYFSKHASEYITPKQVKGTLVVASSKSTAKKVLKLLKKNLTSEAIKGIVNKNKVINVTFVEDTYNVTAKALPKKYKPKTGLSKIYKHNGSFVIVDTKEVIEPKPMTFKEAKGKVISEVQEQEETKWIKELRARYPVVINKAVLKAVKANLK